MTVPEQWRYVPTKYNSVDHLTRGMTSSELVCSEQWWKGPEFLKMVEEKWPGNQSQMSIDAIIELKKFSNLKRKSVTNDHGEKQSLFPDAASAKKATTNEAVEDKLM